MNAAKQILVNLIEEIPLTEVPEIIDFIAYLKLKRERELFNELEKASGTSMSFWDNDIDDKVWNDV